MVKAVTKYIEVFVTDGGTEYLTLAEALRDETMQTLYELDLSSIDCAELLDNARDIHRILGEYVVTMSAVRTRRKRSSDNDSA